MIDYLLTISASSIAIIAYIIYYLNVKKSGIIPNRLAWIICSTSVSLETITYCIVSDDYLKSMYFIVSSVCCIMITIKIWKAAKWEGSTAAQKYSFIFYSVAISIWPIFNLPFIAHLLLLIIIPITFFPIYQSAFQNYKTEKSLPWLLWSLSDVIVIITICFNMKTIQELPYAIVNFICPFTVYSIIIFQRLRHAKSFSPFSFSYVKNQ